MARLSPKQRAMFLIVTLTAVGIMIGMGIILPTLREITTLEQHIATREQTFGEQYEATRELKKSLANLPDIAQKAALYDQATIKKGEELTVITELERLAEQHQVDQVLTISALSETPAGTQPGIAKITLPYYTLSFINHGTFYNHLSFLNAIENLPWYIFIDNVHLEREQTQGPPTNHDILLRFEGRIYIKP